MLIGSTLGISTSNGLRRGGWQPARAGWLVETRNPLTSAQLAQARKSPPTPA
jgi:hypothetical protein